MSESVSEVRALLHLIICALVDLVDEVRIDVVPQGDGIIMLQVFAHPSDLGKIIGKQGRTARSLRTIIAAVGMKTEHKFMLDIVDLRNLSQ